MKLAPHGIVLKLQSARANLNCCLQCIRSGDLKLAEEYGAVAISRIDDLLPTEIEIKERSDKAKMAGQISGLKKKIRILQQQKAHP